MLSKFDIFLILFSVITVIVGIIIVIVVLISNKLYEKRLEAAIKLFEKSDLEKN